MLLSLAVDDPPRDEGDRRGELLGKRLLLDHNNDHFLGTNPPIEARFSGRGPKKRTTT